MLGLSLPLQSIARAVAATMFDPGTGTPIPESRLEWMSRDLAHYASLAGTRTSGGAAAILLAVQFLPLPVIGKLGPFTRLPLADRLRYLQKMEHSRVLAPLFATSKILLSMIYFEHAEVLREVGIDPGCAHMVDPAGVAFPPSAESP